MTAHDSPAHHGLSYLCKQDRSARSCRVGTTCLEVCSICPQVHLPKGTKYCTTFPRHSQDILVVSFCSCPFCYIWRLNPWIPHPGVTRARSLAFLGSAPYYHLTVTVKSSPLIFKKPKSYLCLAHLSHLLEGAPRRLQ